MPFVSSSFLRLVRKELLSQDLGRLVETIGTFQLNCTDGLGLGLVM